MTKRTYDSEARAARASSNMPFIRTSMLLRVQDEIPIDREGGMSIGQFIDEHFRTVAQDGGEVAEFKLELEPGQFKQIYG